MTLRLLSGLAAAALLSACAALPPPQTRAATPACAATAARAPVDARIQLAVEEARRQHRLFGGQTIEPDGGMFRVGHHEAEWWRPAGESAPAWQRVATFWQALSEAEAPSLMTSVGRVALAEAAHAAQSASTAADAPSAADVAVREALLRAALVDTPWSAAFISHLMKAAGFAGEEFAFSDSHSDYVRAALGATEDEAAGRAPRHAFRACDVAATPPRAGDLLCATRASTAHITQFDALPAALAARPPALGFPMHCDLVVRADEGGEGPLEVIGGNVVNSVTLAKMTLDARGVLSDAYVVGAGPRRDCAPGGACRPHLSRRPWLVLLQFRQ